MKVYSKYDTVGRYHKTQSFSAKHVGVVMLLFTTLLLIILKITTWMFARDMLLLKEVKIEGTRFVAQEEILKLAPIDSSKNIFNIDLRSIANQIKHHPLVKDVRVSRRLPSSIIIHVIEKEPLALINKSKLMAIDETGKVLPNLRLEMLLDYPIISKVENQSRELNNILNYLRFIKTNQFTLYSEISEISYSPKMGIYFYLTEGTIPVFMGEQDFELKGSNLLAVLNILNKEKKLSQVEYFDLRFKGQVIVKEIERS